jgi:hypothetical protein
MCRLAVFPPHFEQDRALEILLEMEGGNLDGVGSAHIGADGNFSIKKFPTSLSKIMEKGTPFLDHMAGEGHDGWTIAHLRAKSHGEVAMKNTHPFVINDTWAFAHNGVWSDYSIVKLALSKTVKFEGETDTEVAGHLFAIGGARAFCDTIDASGVFLGLRKDGALYVVKTSGSLEFDELADKRIVGASELKRGEYPKNETVQTGWYYFNKAGKLIKSSKKDTNTHHFASSMGNKWLPQAFKGSKPVVDDRNDEEYTSSWNTPDSAI